MTRLGRPAGQRRPIRLGRRGSILLFLALIDFAYGFSLIGPSAEQLSLATTRWREHYAPVWVWGLGWVLTGVVLLFYAFRRHDAVGYTVAIGWKVMWTLTTFASWAVGGVERGWVGALSWAVVAGMVYRISGWAEPVNPDDPPFPAPRADTVPPEGDRS